MGWLSDRISYAIVGEIYNIAAILYSNSNRVRGRSGVLVRSVYLSWAKSLGAAHWVAQWARWKTVWHVSGGISSDWRANVRHFG